MPRSCAKTVGEGQGACHPLRTTENLRSPRVGSPCRFADGQESRPLVWVSGFTLDKSRVASPRQERPHCVGNWSLDLKVTKALAEGLPALSEMPLTAMQRRNPYPLQPPLAFTPAKGARPNDRTRLIGYQVTVGLAIIFALGRLPLNEVISEFTLERISAVIHFPVLPGR